jgi:hypothetical protein
MSLPAHNRERLVRVLAMLGSAYDGEILAAAMAAHRLVQQHGLAWADVIIGPAPIPQSDPIGWRMMVARCLQRRGSLSPWERQFLNSLTTFRFLTGKQQACLDRIARQVLGDDNG